MGRFHTYTASRAARERKKDRAGDMGGEPLSLVGC
jgi:hypothetical protein